MIRTGIFFGGPSREREISFAGGKTAFEHLDKTLFEPVPLFVDSFGRFIKLREEWMYAGSIREFYPNPALSPEAYRLYVESYPELREQAIPPEIGEIVYPHQFPGLFDVALLAMHGPDCEDGAIQGLLEWYRIPYTGPGIMGSSIGIDKTLQNRMIALINGQKKLSQTIDITAWNKPENREAVFTQLKKKLGLPLVVKAPHQGSSIGVAIVKEDDFQAFCAAVNQCFFMSAVDAEMWKKLDLPERRTWAQKLANLDEGIGFPVYLETQLLYHPEALIAALDKFFDGGGREAVLISSNAEAEVLCEAFIEGQEFSCGCIRLDNEPAVALPPTEVIKVDEVFDFNSKYKPGGTRKRIPVTTSLENNLKIQRHIRRVAEGLGMGVCVRIDGFLTDDDDVLLHDPNTIPGMSPTSLIFKQMAEIGLNVTQALSFFIRQSVYERMRTGKDSVRLRQLVRQLDSMLEGRLSAKLPPRAYLFPNVEEAYAEAKKWFGKTAAEGKYQPEVYLKLEEGKYALLPVQLMFKDLLADVLDRLDAAPDPLIEQTRQYAHEITSKFAGEVSFKTQFYDGTERFSRHLDNTPF